MQKCSRCNRGIKAGTEVEMLGTYFGGECITAVRRVEHLFSDPNHTLQLVRDQYKLYIGNLTKAGLARKKAKLG